MSGPKCNEYVLSEERRRAEYERLERELRRIEEERREEERRQKERERRLEEERRRREEEKRLEEERRIEEERRRREEEKRREEERIRKEKQDREDYAVSFNEQEEREFQALLDAMFEQREQEIVAEAIDEALEEMGYEMVASMTPKVQTDNLCRAQVYEFSEGTGIQVMAANGQISLEIVGIGNNNRVPTEQESEYLEQQMEQFCDAYKVLEQKLEEKGIVRAAAIRHNSPDKKFARILNVSAFQQKKEVETLQTFMKKEQARENAGQSAVQAAAQAAQRAPAQAMHKNNPK